MTLLVDLDSQRNATTTLMKPDEITTTLADVLVGDREREPVKNAVYETEVNNLDLIPSSIRLAKIDRFIDLEEQFRLRTALNELTEYDFIILDCPPTLGMTLQQAFLTATHVIIPIAADYYSHEGVDDLLESLQKAKVGNPSLSVLGCLVTRFDVRQRIAKQSERTTREKYREYVFDVTINERAAIKSAPSKRLTIFEYDENAAADYLAFVDEVMNRLMLGKLELVRSVK